LITLRSLSFPFVLRYLFIPPLIAVLWPPPDLWNYGGIFIRQQFPPRDFGGMWRGGGTVESPLTIPSVWLPLGCSRCFFQHFYNSRESPTRPPPPSLTPLVGHYLAAGPWFCKESTRPAFRFPASWVACLGNPSTFSVGVASKPYAKKDCFCKQSGTLYPAGTIFVFRFFCSQDSEEINVHKGSLEK